jgi:hypothetical protein
MTMTLFLDGLLLPWTLSPQIHQIQDSSDKNKKIPKFIFGKKVRGFTPNFTSWFMIMRSDYTVTATKKTTGYILHIIEYHSNLTGYFLLASTTNEPSVGNLIVILYYVLQKNKMKWYCYCYFKSLSNILYLSW